MGKQASCLCASGSCLRALHIKSSGLTHALMMPNVIDAINKFAIIIIHSPPPELPPPAGRQPPHNPHPITPWYECAHAVPCRDQSTVLFLLLLNLVGVAAPPQNVAGGEGVEGGTGRQVGAGRQLPQVRQHLIPRPVRAAPWPDFTVC